MRTTRINSRKYDQTIRRSWDCEFVKRVGSLLTFRGVFNEEVLHSDLGEIAEGTISYEYYWLDRWYNVFRFHEPDGTFRNFYCNINVPPIYTPGVLDYVDLDIDVVVWKDHSYAVLDLDDYSVAVERYTYPLHVQLSAEKALAELIEMINGRKFPFDEDGDRR